MNIRPCLSLLLSLACAVLWQSNALAYSYTCQTTSGTPVKLSASFGNVTITDPEQNKPGQELDNFATWSRAASAHIICDAPKATRKFTGKSDLPVSSVDSGKTWYNVNEYLDAAVSTRGHYIPFTNVSGGIAGDQGGNMQLTFGASGYIDIRFKKAFIGSTTFTNLHIADIYMTHSSSVQSPIPLLSVYLSGSVTVPQNCTINAGAVIKIDLGTMYNTDFTTAGQKPNGVTPKSFPVPITCNYGASIAALTLRMEGTPSAEVSSALQTDNKDVGVIVADSNGTPLRPGDFSSHIPLSLDAVDSDTYTSNVMLQVWPVSTTGLSPAEGTFTALATLRIDFD